MIALENIYNSSFDSVLSDPKYNLLQKKSVNVWEVIKNLVIKLIEKILELFRININFDDNGSAGILTGVFLFIVSVITIVVIVMLVRLLVKRKKRAKTMNELFQELKLKKITVYDLISSANEYKASGDTRKCLHYRFAAILWLLNQKNIIKGFDTKTNYQIQRELYRNNADISESYTSLNNGFNKTWYGYKNMTADEFKNWESTFNELLVVLTEEENEKAN